MFSLSPGGYHEIREDEERRIGEMLRKYRAGETVKKGTYWNFSNGQRVSVDREGVLTGDGAFYKMSPAGVLVLGPILGLVYAVFLPFIGIAMLVKLVGEKIIVGLLSLVASTFSFKWRPLEAYLAGKKRSKNNGKKEEKKTGTGGA